jgi:hypothetical protein
MGSILRRYLISWLGVACLFIGSFLVSSLFSAAIAVAPSDSRAIAISLRELHREANTPEGRRLFGATILRGFSVFTDAEGPNVVLLTVRTPGRPSLRLDDFLVAWLNVSSNREWPGCSIDPLPETIRRLEQISRRFDEAERPEQEEALINEWVRVAQAPQQVLVFGVSRNTHFAQVMVEADYFLKDVTQGRAKLAGVRSLFEMRWEEALAALRDPNIPPGSGGVISRFWFNAGDLRVYRDESTVILDECPVVLRTEEEAALPDGTTRGLGRPEPLAKQFAEEFTRNFEAIAEAKPIYRELQNLYHMVAIADLLYRQEESAHLQEMIDTLVRVAPIERSPVAATLPGKTRTEKAEIEEVIPGGTLVARTWVLVCGGVAVNPRVTVRSQVQAPLPMLEEINRCVLRFQPGPKATWWDMGPGKILYSGR